MPNSPTDRPESRPFWRALQVALAALLGSAVLFVALTRTEVGRNEIRRQIEAVVNHRIAGTLSIGTLTGTMIDDFVATDVRLRDPSGRVVATVDSIIAEPQWANLLTAELSMQTLRAVRPHLTLHRDSTGTWDLSEALRRDGEGSITFRLASVHVQGGRVTTSRAGNPPPSVRSGWLFDYTRSEVHNLSLEASARRTASTSRLNINSASFALPDPNIQVGSLRGSVRRTSKGWFLDDVDLSLDTTRIRAEGALHTPRSTSRKNPFELQLARSRLDHDELRRLVPRLPLSEIITVEGGIRGVSDRLVLEETTITHNASFVTLAGNLSRESPSRTVDLALREGRLTPADVREVWPGLPALPDTSIGRIALDGTVQGTVSWSSSSPRLDLESQIAARNAHGAVRGSLSVARSETDPIQYAGSFDVDSLNLAPLTGSPSLASRINGHLDLQGTGSDLRRGQAQVTLASSKIGVRHFTAINGQVRVEDGSAQGTMTLRQPTGGTLRMEGHADSLDRRPRYTATVSTTQFDLASPEGALPSTRLNAQLDLRGTGIDWRSLTGSAVLKVDSSQVRRGDSTIVLPPHSATLRLAERSQDRPRVSLTGTVGSLTIDGPTLGPPLWTSSRLWARALQEAVQRELDKPAPSQTFTTLEPLFSPSSPSTRASLRADSRRRLRRPDLAPPLHLQAHLQIDQSDILHKWWPVLPDTSEALSADASFTVSADSLHATGQFSATTLRQGATMAEDLTLQFDLSGHLRAPLAETMQASINLSARHLTVGGPHFLAPSVSLQYEDRSGTLNLRADSVGLLGPVQIASDLSVAPDENELRVREASVELRGDEWTNPSPASIFAYANSIVVTPLILERAHPQTLTSQRLQIDGTVSSSPSDTLTVAVDNLYLPPVSRVLGAPKLIGGELTGQIHLQEGWSRPRLQSDLSVRRLSYDRRILGDAQLSAEYTSESPDLRLEASIATDARRADSLAGPDMVGGGARTVEPNELSLSGHIRLPEQLWLAPPQRASETPEGDALDLDAEVTRADLFFFRYIFEERVADVRGYTTGTVQIGGRLGSPIFDADLAIENAYVSLPLFGLEYEAEGSVTVDREGIHVTESTVRDEEGSASVEGSILFNDYEYFSFDLSATLDAITVIDVSQAEDLPFYGHIRASGPLTLTGPLPDATLRSNAGRTTPDSELFIPVSSGTVVTDPGFIVFADSTGKIPDLQKLTRRENILADRPEGEPSFVEGLNLDLNVTAPEGSTVHLVFDPIVGDVVTAVGSARVQLQRKEGNFQVFGTFNASSGNYLFTAGEVFVRQFSITGGSITWDGDPINAQMNLNAEYRTRASPAGLPGYENYRGRIPVRVLLDITSRVSTPQVDLSLSLIQNEQNRFVGSETLNAILNQPARRTEYATSVLLTNTFLLTTESLLQEGGTQTERPNRLTTAGNQLAFNSVSQLISSQLNRYLGAAFSNLDLNLGVQGEDPNDLDLVYGLALRLLNERLVIRGEGVYTGDDPETRQVQGPQGEFVVEVRLSPSVSVEVFYRRTGDELTRNRALTNNRGAGLSYQRQFSTWKSLLNRLFGWLLPSDAPPEDPDSDTVAERRAPPADSSSTSGGNPNP